ncbi:hypothetical protein CSUI_005901, partial [Cystoisospora suis]
RRSNCKEPRSDSLQKIAEKASPPLWPKFIANRVTQKPEGPMQIGGVNSICHAQRCRARYASLLQRVRNCSRH